MALKPIVSEIYVFVSKVGNSEVDAFTMFPDCDAEFDKFGDSPALVAGSVSVVYWNWYYCLFCVQAVLLDVSTINGASGASTVYECLRFERLSSCAWFNGYGDQEIS